MSGALQPADDKDMKSVRSAGTGSVPEVQTPTYLELYAARREKHRLDNEIVALERTRDSACKQLAGIKKRIGKLEEEVHEQQKSKKHKAASCLS